MRQTRQMLWLAHETALEQASLGRLVLNCGAIGLGSMAAMFADGSKQPAKTESQQSLSRGVRQGQAFSDAKVFSRRYSEDAGARLQQQRVSK
jgi:hypothetical protein